MEQVEVSPAKPLQTRNLNRLFLVVIVSSVILGAGVGFVLGKGNQSSGQISSPSLEVSETPKNPQADSRTFRDFAEGRVEKKPAPKKADEYVEGTHMLVREAAQPVALTSSVLDLAQYEGKKVKVFGETQKALKEGWLMDVGKVEVKE